MLYFFRAGIKVPASSALGVSYFRSAGVLVLIINWFVISHFIGGPVVTLWQSFKLCHLNFGGERGHTAFSFQEKFYKFILRF